MLFNSVEFIFGFFPVTALVFTASQAQAIGIRDTFAHGDLLFEVARYRPLSDRLASSRGTACARFFEDDWDFGRSCASQ